MLDIKERVWVTTEREAKSVLSSCRDILKEYHFLSVADVMETVGAASDSIDTRWGWKNIDDAKIVEYGSRYSIEFPKVIKAV